MHRACRHALTLLVALAALISAGCGSGDDPQLSKREYIERFNTLQADASEVFAELAASASDPKAAAAHLATFERLRDGVQALDPPDQWRTQHATLVEALGTMHQSMGIIAKARATKTEVITTQVRRYTAAQRDFQAAVAAINETR
ncbi:MAG: hypothetical protein JWO69_352 [Thermoleophilia bacterium]|nr:hypothetical protein [Thermoleophilia bacterium]